MRQFTLGTTALVLIGSLFVTACSSESGESGEISGPSAETVIPASDVLPLVSAEGAEPGLRGCFNRALYFNGPHFVNTAESQSMTFGDVPTSAEITTDLTHTVVEVADDGAALVDVERTTLSSASDMGTAVESFILTGYTLTNLGVDRANPNPLPFTLDFGLDEGETFSFESVTGADGSTSIIEGTYLGRERVEIAGQSVEACKVGRVIFDDVGDPSFNTSVASTIWYGFGTGLTLKTDAIRFPFSDLDRSTTVTNLNGASVNSIQVF